MSAPQERSFGFLKILYLCVRGSLFSPLAFPSLPSAGSVWGCSAESKLQYFLLLLQALPAAAQQELTSTDKSWAGEMEWFGPGEHLMERNNSRGHVLREGLEKATLFYFIPLPPTPQEPTGRAELEGQNLEGELDGQHLGGAKLGEGILSPSLLYPWLYLWCLLSMFRNRLSLAWNDVQSSRSSVVPDVENFTCI